jgi:basic membrane lipoprotein Med (substrate-binding protein (PBP1-ABC) superfamily)
VRAKIVDGSAAGGIRAALDGLEDTAQLVIAPYSGDRAAATRFASETEIPTLVWGDPDALRADLVGDVELAGGEGTFAAGMIASHASIFQSVGIVVCDDAAASDLEARYEMASAFVAGAREDNPKVEVFYARAGDGGEADAAVAKAATIDITRDRPLQHGSDTARQPGAQMVLALCGTATPGVMQGIEQADEEHQLVGIIGDKGTINKENMVVTSAMWNAAPVFAHAMKDIRAGTFGREPYRLDFAHNGIELLSTGRTPGDAFEVGNEAKERFLRELIGLPEKSTEEALKAFIAE